MSALQEVKASQANASQANDAAQEAVRWLIQTACQLCR